MNVSFLDLLRTLPILFFPILSLSLTFPFPPFPPFLFFLSLFFSLCATYHLHIPNFQFFRFLSTFFPVLPTSFLSLSVSLRLSVLISDLTSRPRSPPQPPPPPLPPGRPPPPTPPQERVTDMEAVGGGAAASGPEECEERERDAPLRQLEGAEAEEREGGRARAIDNQYSFF